MRKFTVLGILCLVFVSFFLLVGCSSAKEKPIQNTPEPTLTPGLQVRIIDSFWDGSPLEDNFVVVVQNQGSMAAEVDVYFEAINPDTGEAVLSLKMSVQSMLPREKRIFSFINFRPLLWEEMEKLPLVTTVVWRERVEVRPSS